MKITNHNIAAPALAAMLTLSLSACNDWLSVQPQQQVEDTELLSSQSGYKEALAGVYSSMVNANTYAKELTFGTMSILAQEWDNFPTTYQDMDKYDYEATAPTGTIAAIWETSYNSIANANNILKHIDEAQGLFTGDNYAIIKGETLGLRAFIHFDLLRCFGVGWAVNPDQPAIPYVTDFTYRVFPQLTVRQVIEKINSDLAEAEKLLAVDPILTGRTVTELDDAGYLMNRTVHFNYYAVKALQARVAMWVGDYPAAALAAQEIMDSERFSWTAQELMSNGTDTSMADEQIFALNNVNLSTLADTYFNDERNSTSFSITRANHFSIYDNETTDLRYLFLFLSGETGESIDNRYCAKFNQSSSSDLWYINKMPMMRIGEMQLILAECANQAGGTGMEEINALREARNVPVLEEAPENFYDYLIREYRRELIGEGQLFFLLKRLDRQYIPGTDIDARDSKAYTFPLPKSETESAECQPNR